MKKVTLALLTALTLSAAAFANEKPNPCCMCGEYIETTLPITGPLSPQGNKKITGNGDVPSYLNFTGAVQIAFQGTQHNFSPISLNSQYLYNHGIIEHEFVSASGNSVIWANQNTTVIINHFDPKGSKVRIISYDNSGLYIIEGAQYRVGDIVKGIKIESCTQPLPAVFSEVSANFDGSAVVTKWKVESQVNVGLYQIEFSKNGIDWWKAADVKAKGGGGAHSYEFTDYREFAIAFGLGFLLVGFKRRARWLAVPALALLALGCTKECETPNEEFSGFARVRAVDIDGGSTLSKTVKIIKL